MNRYLIFWVLFLLLVASTVFGQTLLHQNYLPEQYGGATQNFAVVEDHRGIIYVGNTEGVLEYDGSSWRLIRTPALVRSLAVGEDGKVYVGTVGDFGLLVPDKKGQLFYHSIRDLIPSGGKVFKDVWQILSVGEAVYFSTREILFCLKGGLIRQYEPDEMFGFALSCRDEVYVQEMEGGLSRFDNGIMQELPGTAAAGLTLIRGIFPLEKDKLMLCTQREGLFIYSLAERRLLPLAKDVYGEVNALLKDLLPYGGTVLPNGNIAVATVRGGVVVMTPQGDIVRQLNETKGLRSNAVYQTCVDGNGQLWMATDDGISMVTYATDYVFLTEQDGPKGKVYATEAHQGDIYVGTSDICYKVGPAGELEEVNGTDRETWFLKSTGTELLGSHFPKGFLQFYPEGAKRIPEGGDVVGLALSEVPGSPDLMIGSSHNGFYILARRSGRWEIRNQIKEFNRAIYGANTDMDGNLWLRCAPNDLYQIRFSPDLRKLETVRRHDILEGGKAMSTPIPYRLADGQVVFGTDQGVFVYAEEQDSFLRFPPMKSLRGDVSPIYQDHAGNLWYEESKNGNHTKGVFYREEKGWRHDSLVLQRFANIEMYKGPTNLMTETDDGRIVLGTTKGLIIHNPKAQEVNKRQFPTQIRRVFVNDTLHFANGYDTVQPSRPLSFGENNIRLEYSGLFYDESDRNTFSSRLLGRDSSWSAFTPAVSREYTNLPFGAYTFEVKARNLYYEEGTVASYRFSILPPWYRTLWAYVSYAILLALAGVLFFRLGASRQRRKNEQLERLIDRRTTQLRQEKERSEELSQNLLQVFTIIGHDLRRPVLAFQGITKKVNFLLRKKDFTRLEKLGDGIEEEARSLYQLTDNLLNWATTQKGTKPYQPALLSAREVFKEATLGMQKTFDQQQFDLEVTLPDGHVFYADRSSLVTVFRNLMDNATKFTPPAGKIAVTSRMSDDNLVVAFHSASPAIPEELLSTLFKAGVQNREAPATVSPGSGIGLHICRELMLLNKGTVAVENAPQQGVVFTLTVPIKPTE